MWTAFCALSQNSGVVRRAAPSLSAISVVTALRPLTMRLITLKSQPRWFANSFWLMPRGARNSSLYTLVINGWNDPRISDGVDHANVPSSRTFPYLVAPNPTPPEPPNLAALRA